MLTRPKAETIAVKCAVCRTSALAARVRVSLGAHGVTWLQPPPGWYALLGNATGAPHVRCPGCLVGKGGSHD